MTWQLVAGYPTVNSTDIFLQCSGIRNRVNPRGAEWGAGMGQRHVDAKILHVMVLLTTL